mgnify:CR=1 FL=1
MRVPCPSWNRQERPRIGGRGGKMDDEDDVEAIILRNLWKRQRLLPPRSKNRAYWDAVRSYMPHVHTCCLRILG